MMNRLPWRRLGALLLASSILGACGPPDTMEITLRRSPRTGPDPARPGVSSAARFGAESATARPPAAEATLAWDVPPGWEELPASGMRLANLRPGGDPDAECSVIQLSGSGGSVLGNVNRWRGQMGLDPIAEADLETLPHADALGGHGIRVVLHGAYSGMGDQARADWALLGVIIPGPSATLFVKMTGPAALVEAETGAFDAFCASLRLENPEPRVAAAGGGTGAAGPLGYDVPAGWRDVGPDGMRVVNLAAGAETQCYVITLRGEAGGLLGNLNRWRNEFGLEPLGEAAVEALPTVDLFGNPCPLLELTGEYSGMGGGLGGGKAMLGTLLIRSSESVFVKMVGPAEEIATLRDGFVALVESLEENGR